MKKIIRLLMRWLAVGSWFLLFVHTAQANPVAVGQEIPKLDMLGLAGPAKNLGDFRGHPLLINVWASWCGPCRQEMGSLDRLSRKYGNGRLTIIGISTDDYPERAIAQVKKSKVRFANFIDHQLVLESMLGADRIPLTVLVDAKGRVVARYYGAREWDAPENIQLLNHALNIKP